MTGLTRATKDETVTIAESAHLSGAIDMRDYSGGILVMPAAWTTADIGFHISDAIDGTFVPLKDHDDAYVVVDAPDVDTAFELPPEIFGAHFVKLWSTDGAGANTAQAAARSLLVMLKG